MKVFVQIGAAWGYEVQNTRLADQMRKFEGTETLRRDVSCDKPEGMV